ncbi:MAG: hypothetical protein K2M07_00885 [Muribaculaceae bacterium]|nr:hypothetical protein [Muribaculaceae bacterium]
MKNYYKYRKKILELLSNKVRTDKSINPGEWQGVIKNTYTHILPLDGKNCRKSREDAIREYLEIEIKEDFLPRGKKGCKETLHPYAHHLNSSQLLCYATFQPLLEEENIGDATHHPKEELIKLIKDLLCIDISKDAKCKFEYIDDLKWEKRDGSIQPEGTSFDFHIADKNIEVFFEIKFTEFGFGKAKNDENHKEKIEDTYLFRVKDIVGKKVSKKYIIQNYQLFRNIIRSNSEKKLVVFITDNSNPKTSDDICKFDKDFLTSSHANVKFVTWQDICNNWPKDIAMPFQFTCFETPK